MGEPPGGNLPPPGVADGGTPQIPGQGGTPGATDEMMVCVGAPTGASNLPVVNGGSSAAASDGSANSQVLSQAAGGNVESSRKDNKVLYDPDYQYQDFKVIVQLSRESSQKYLSLHKVGKLLAEASKNAKIILDKVRLSRNKALILCADAVTANELVTTDRFPKDFNFYIPINYVSRVAIIREIDVEFTEEEIYEALETRQFKLLHVQRLTRKQVNDNKVVYVPSQTMKLTFAGPDIPKHVILWYSRIPCEPFVQSTVQCFKCLRFGHITKVCKSRTQICKACYQHHDDNQNCNISQVQCVNCKGMHNPKSPSCPELERQKNIKLMMSNRNLCYLEAAILFPAPYMQKSSYAAPTHNSFDALSGLNGAFPSLVSSTNLGNDNDKLDRFVVPPLPYKPNSQRNTSGPNKITVTRQRKRDNEVLNFDNGKKLKKPQINHFEHENLNTGVKVSELFYEKCAERKLEQQEQKSQMSNIINNPREKYNQSQHTNTKVGYDFLKSNTFNSNVLTNTSIDTEMNDSSLTNKNWDPLGQPKSPDFT